MTAKKQRAKKHGGSVLILLLILTVLGGVGWQLRSLRQQVQSAQMENEQYARQVREMEQSNAALRSDITEGATDEKMEEIAREELGWTKDNEYVFYDKQS